MNVSKIIQLDQTKVLLIIEHERYLISWLARPMSVKLLETHLYISNFQFNYSHSQRYHLVSCVKLASSIISEFTWPQLHLSMTLKI